MFRSQHRPKFTLDLARWLGWSSRLLLWGLILPAAGWVALQEAFPPAAADPPPAGGAPQVGPLDQPLGWIYEARKFHQGVRDYSCTFIKQERVKGVLQPENIIVMKFRNQPFSVNMRWLAPRNLQNQEVSFIHGRNRNQMRVHSKGVLGVAGFVSIEPNDPRVMQHSRHTIYEAGIGNLIEQTAKGWELERQVGKSQVKVAEYDYNRRRVFRIDTTRTERNPQFYCYRSVIYLDKDSKLPIRNENYDWPRPGGPPEGELLEVFSYIDLNLNVGLSDNDFVR